MISREKFSLQIQNQTFTLLPEKAIFWMEEKGLIISDVHLGKAGHFRKHGIALPQSSNDENLKRIDTLINELHPEWILFLGDLFHSTKNEEWDTFKKWRSSHPSIVMHLVMGNHELYPEEEYQMLGVICIQKLPIGPFLFLHDKNEFTSKIGTFVISGHVHPAIRLKGKGRQSVRIPCFYFDEHSAILPAFGSLTGTHTIKNSKSAQIFGVIDDQILKIQ